MSSLQGASQPEAPGPRIPRFLWRVESRQSRHRVLESSDWGSQDVDFDRRDELRSYISDHMRGVSYYAPFVITSLTGSLLWALNYAHYVFKSTMDVNIVLLDTWGAPEYHIYPAGYLSARLEIPRLGISWHDNPYHEYFVLGDFPLDAVLGSFELESLEDPDINTLVPGFGTVLRGERLGASLWRLQDYFNFMLPVKLVKLVKITNDDLQAAVAVASNFLYTPDRDIQFMLVIMFLALRNRNWDQPGVWPVVREMFRGARLSPSSWAVSTYCLMPDVGWWVKGMERIQLECRRFPRQPES